MKLLNYITSRQRKRAPGSPLGKEIKSCLGTDDVKLGEENVAEEKTMGMTGDKNICLTLVKSLDSTGSG